MKTDNDVVVLSDSDDEENQTPKNFVPRARISPLTRKQRADNEEQLKAKVVEVHKQPHAKELGEDFVKDRKEVASNVENGSTLDNGSQALAKGSESDDEDDDYDKEVDDPEELDSAPVQSNEPDSAARLYPQRRHSGPTSLNKNVTDVSNAELGRAFKCEEETYSYSPDVLSLILEVPNAGLDMKEALSQYRLKKERTKYFGKSILKGGCYNVADFKDFGTPDEEANARMLMRKWYIKLHDPEICKRNRNSCSKRDVVAAMSKIRGQDVNYPEYISNYMYRYLSKGRSYRVWNLCTAVMEFHNLKKTGVPAAHRAAVTRTRQEADVYIAQQNGSRDRDRFQNVDRAEADASVVAGNSDAEVVHKMSELTAKSEVLGRPADSLLCQRDHGVNVKDAYRVVLAEMEPMRPQPERVTSDLESGNVDVNMAEPAFDAAAAFEGRRPVKQESKENSHGIPSKRADPTPDAVQKVISDAKEQVTELLTNAIKDTEKRLEEEAVLKKDIREQEVAENILERNLEMFRDDLRARKEQVKKAGDQIRDCGQNISLLEKHRDDLIRNEHKRKRQQEQKTNVKKKQEEEEQELLKDVDAASKLAKKLAVSFAERE